LVVVVVGCERERQRDKERVGGVLSIAVFVFVCPVYLDVERRRGFGS
jgi:hypothetical protein